MMNRVRFTINKEDRSSDHAIDSKRGKNSLIVKVMLANGSQMLFGTRSSGYR
jgi:hypothetical protein